MFTAVCPLGLFAAVQAVTVMPVRHVWLMEHAAAEEAVEAVALDVTLDKWSVVTGKHST